MTAEFQISVFASDGHFGRPSQERVKSDFADCLALYRTHFDATMYEMHNKWAEKGANVRKNGKGL